MASESPLPGLLGRARECEALDRLLADVRKGQSAVLVISGEAGVGKTALLRYVKARASEFRIAEIAGIEAEMELSFAALHQLCAPMLAHTEKLPVPQRDALRVAFGLESGEAPDRFLVALAALSLLAEVAEERPLLCIVEDAHWLDSASGKVLGFVARRLLAESVAVVFVVRESSLERQLAGLPELRLGGIDDEHASVLLTSIFPGRLDERVRDRVVAESRGNPLALLELPRGLSAAELAGGFALSDTRDLPGHIEDRYLRRVRALPPQSQKLLLLAAADPVGDPTLLWRAADTLGIETSALIPAAEDELLQIGTQVTFRHPLVRSAVYGAASSADRQEVHAALAVVTDRESDPDRHAWHAAQATYGPDEEVARELERSAGRAQARGGLAAAAAFLERSATLSGNAAQRVERLLAAVQFNVQVGEFEAALRLLAAAESETQDEYGFARLDLLRGRVAAASGARGEAPAQLLKAAKRLEPLDATLARETYLDAWAAAFFAGSLASSGNLLEVSRAVMSAGPANSVLPTDLLLDGLAGLTTEGRIAAMPTLKRATRGFRDEHVSVEKGLQWGIMATLAAATVWDFESWDAILIRQVELARDAGALAMLSMALTGRGNVVTWRGDFEEAASLIAEARAINEATGTRIAPYGAMLLAAFRGRPVEASLLIESAVKDATDSGEGRSVAFANWAIGVLYNGLGRYEDAVRPAQQASEEWPEQALSAWALVELIEASIRCGKLRVAADAMQQLASATEGSDSEWGRGVEARSRALLSTGKIADGLYREAVQRLSCTQLRPELARAHLLHGEWLRRQNRPKDAREQLRTAYDMFASMGAAAFTDRARRELLATGEKVRKRRDETTHDLTPQEDQIARLAAQGETSRDIAGRLFISANTVDYHLKKIYRKLGVSSRRELRRAFE